MAARKKKDETAPAAPAVKFEEALEKLEASVRRLDSENLPLEEALAEYERGLAALKMCRSVLDAAEKRLQVLVGEKNGEAEVEDFDPRSPEDPREAASARPARPKERKPRAPVESGDAPWDDEPDQDEPKGPRDGFLF